MKVQIIVLVSYLIIITIHYEPYPHLQDNSQGQPVSRKVRIGIVTKPCADEVTSITCKNLIDAVYVNWIKNAGGVVIPIPFDSTKSEIEELFLQTNGLFAIGGGDILLRNNKYTQYTLTSKYLLKLIFDVNTKGIHYPIWGTCLGFQLISMLIADDSNILTWCPDFQCVNYPTMIKFQTNHSKIFETFTREQNVDLTTKNITFNYHNWMIEPENFYNSSNLVEFFNLIATSRSNDGKIEFISVLESKLYPIYLVQFHPEFNNFPPLPIYKVVNTTENELIATACADYLIKEGRKNMNYFGYLGDMVGYQGMETYDLVYTKEYGDCYVRY